MDFKKLIESPEYDFLRTNKNLGDNVICLGLGGSHAYGTNVETSDVDIRGVAINKIDELLLGRDFEEVVNQKTDTTIYSLRKAVNLLAKCNPNMIEILGLRDDQILVTSPEWKKIQENSSLFLSKRCIASFGGYANSQLRRLETKSARELGAAKKEEYILGSIENSGETWDEKYARDKLDVFNLYIDKSDNPERDHELFVDARVNHYPFRDYAAAVNQFNSVIRDYDKMGVRNAKAIEHGKLGKHMMHLVRLYYMAFDIMEKGEINTYREKEHDMLMSIRNGEWLIDSVKPKDEFYRFVDKLQERFDRDKETTKLPADPDMEKIERLYLNIMYSWESKLVSPCILR